MQFTVNLKAFLQIQKMWLTKNTKSFCSLTLNPSAPSYEMPILFQLLHWNSSAHRPKLWGPWEWLSNNRLCNSPPNNTVMSRRSVSHFHGRKLEEAFSKSHTAKEELPDSETYKWSSLYESKAQLSAPVTTVATSVLVLRAPGASPNAINIPKGQWYLDQTWIINDKDVG